MQDSFRPPRGLRNPHVQTLLSYAILRYKEPASETHLITLPDGDQLSLEISTPGGWKESNLTVLMMPGTAGTHQSPYLVRLVNKLLGREVRAVRLNFRGRGPAVGRAKLVSHGGSTLDILAAMDALKKMTPNSPLVVIGFSLSGGTLLKLAGEVDLSRKCEKIIAVCPPLSLLDSSKRLEKFQNRLYQKSIVKAIIEAVESKESQFSYRPKKPLKSCKTLREIDDHFTAPSSGFSNALEYYEKCSCLPLIDKIESPCHILFAKDDPLICSEKINGLTLPKNIDVLKTRYGGHMGFFKGSLKNPFWMDELLFSWMF